MSELATLPGFERKRFFRMIAKAAEEYLKDPENKKRFEEWKKEEARKKAQEQERKNENEA